MEFIINDLLIFNIKTLFNKQFIIYLFIINRKQHILMTKKSVVFSNKSTILISIIISILFSSSFSQITQVIPLYKLLIAGDINKFKEKEKYNTCFKPKGVGIIFNKTSEISIMPEQLFYEITKYYQVVYDLIDKVEPTKNGYNLYLIVECLRPDETIHFILKDMGITIPLKTLFYDNDEDEGMVYYFRFLTKKDQENIIIGKDLIDLMDITFIDDTNFIINNKSFVTNVKEENDI